MLEIMLFVRPTRGHGGCYIGWRTAETAETLNFHKNITYIRIYIYICAFRNIMKIYDLYVPFNF